jgi:hypothetical protein
VTHSTAADSLDDSESPHAYSNTQLARRSSVRSALRSTSATAPIALSARADFHKLSFYAALIAPLGDDTSSVVDFAAIGGIEFLLQ